MRIRIVERLDAHGEASVQALADELGATQQNVSRHLGLLLRATVVARRQEGRTAWYRLSDGSAFALLHAGAHDVLRALERTDPHE